MTKPLPYPKGIGSSQLWRQLRAACDELELLERWQLTRAKQVDTIYDLVELAYDKGYNDGGNVPNPPTELSHWTDIANKIIELTEVS